MERRRSYTTLTDVAEIGQPHIGGGRPVDVAHLGAVGALTAGARAVAPRPARPPARRQSAIAPDACPCLECHAPMMPGASPGFRYRLPEFRFQISQFRDRAQREAGRVNSKRAP